jgi:TPR repeat protein
MRYLLRLAVSSILSLLSFGEKLMKSVKHYLLFFIVVLNINTAYADTESKALAELCGDSPCEVIFKKIKKFAKNGSPHAQAVLALLYRNGQGTEVNDELSLKYMKRAARNKIPSAMYDLGLMYRSGKTVKQDQEEGDAWLKRAAKADYGPAIELLLTEKKVPQAEYPDYRGDADKPSITQGIEEIEITRDPYTLSDLVAYLEGLGFSRKSNTGSRIRGQGCGTSDTSCAIWKVNSPLGQVQFNGMISNLNSIQTANFMSSFVK